MPYTPAGIFLVDQWRQIGVEVDHKQSDTSPYIAAMTNGNFDVAIDFSNLFMDDSTLALAKYLSFDKAPTEHVAFEGSGARQESIRSICVSATLRRGRRWCRPFRSGSSSKPTSSHCSGGIASYRRTNPSWAGKCRRAMCSAGSGRSMARSLMTL